MHNLIVHFFSDLLRVALLKAYGGVWLDVTILLTNRLPGKYEKLDFFMFNGLMMKKIKIIGRMPLPIILVGNPISK